MFPGFGSNARWGPLRIAYLRGESQAVTFSVHGAIAKHYKIAPAALNESHASTLDYVNCRLNGGHVDRVHEMYAMHCPLFRTLDKAIQLTSSWTLVPPPVGSSV